MRASDLLLEYYEYSEDQDKIGLYDTRRPRLTFKKLRQMRKAKDVHKATKEEHLKDIPDIYGSSVE